MNDGLEIGVFERTDTAIIFKKHENIHDGLLPYGFELYDGKDVTKVLYLWGEDRVPPPNRLEIKRILKMHGLKKYDHMAMCFYSRFGILHDPYWIALEETDTFTKNTIRGKARMNPNPWGFEVNQYKWRI